MSDTNETTGTSPACVHVALSVKTRKRPRGFQSEIADSDDELQSNTTRYKRNVEVAADLLADVSALKMYVVALTQNSTSWALCGNLIREMSGVPERAEAAAREMVARLA